MQGTYAVIGDPIDHSLSPSIHNAAFRALGMDCSYIAYRIKPDELRDGLESLKAAQVVGFNVTIPHKIAIMDILDDADAECTKAGACNTVSVNNGRLEGHNTDVRGFLDPLERHGTRLSQAKALVLGAGGAASAIVSGLLQKNAEITVAARSEPKAQSLAERTGAEIETIHLKDAGSVADSYDIIINATPIGMNGEPSPIPAESIRADATVYEIVYRPLKTALVACALERGASVIYGYEMLLAQAALSFEIWHKTEAPYDAMKQAILGIRAP